MRTYTTVVERQSYGYLGAVIGVVLAGGRAETGRGENGISNWQLSEWLAARNSQFGMGEYGEAQHRHDAVLGSSCLEVCRRKILEGPDAKSSHLNPLAIFKRML